MVYHGIPWYTMVYYGILLEALAMVTPHVPRPRGTACGILQDAIAYYGYYGIL